MAGIAKENRIYTLCNEGIGDEFHTLFICKNADVSALGSTSIPNYYVINPSKNKFTGLMSIFYDR